MSKELIISKLEDLKKMYSTDESKIWSIKAISSAINSIKKYDKDIVSSNELRDIKGIGKKISKRIDEILETGTLAELPNKNNLNNESSYIENLILITGVGLVRAKKWVKEGIHNIDMLKEAIKNKSIKTTHHIDIGIKYYEDFQKKIPREEIDTMKNIISKCIYSIDSKIIFEICGSYRRGLKESSDIDILLTHPFEKDFLKKTVKSLTKINFITDSLTEKGDTKFMGVCKIDKSPYGRRIDIRYVNYESYFTSLLYFTGSKNFNIYLRNKALEKNYSLNEYFLTNLNDNSKIVLNSEEEIFKILNIPYVFPVERDLF
jgi:DNA polymerase beta